MQKQSVTLLSSRIVVSGTNISCQLLAVPLEQLQIVVNKESLVAAVENVSFSSFLVSVVVLQYLIGLCLVDVSAAGGFGVSIP